MTPSRPAIHDALRQAVTAHPAALAAWEGGSAAFGADDAMSDVDLVVVSDEKDAVFAAVEAALEALAPIALRHHVPEPAWHGFAQRFYLLEGASPYHLVDLAVQPTTAADRFLDPERHGAARVWFDRGGYAVAQPGDPEALSARLAARVPVLTTWFAMTQPMVTKELDRGRPLDALNFYQGLTLRPLVELLRIVHAPARHDFGLRYLERDLPAEVYARLLPLAFVGDPVALRARHAEAVAWFEALALPPAGGGPTKARPTGGLEAGEGTRGTP